MNYKLEKYNDLRNQYLKYKPLNKIEFNKFAIEFPDINLLNNQYLIEKPNAQDEKDLDKLIISLQDKIYKINVEGKLSKTKIKELYNSYFTYDNCEYRKIKLIGKNFYFWEDNKNYYIINNKKIIKKLSKENYNTILLNLVHNNTLKLNGKIEEYESNIILCKRIIKNFDNIQYLQNNIEIIRKGE